MTSLATVGKIEPQHRNDGQDEEPVSERNGVARAIAFRFDGKVPKQVDEIGIAEFLASDASLEGERTFEEALAWG